MELKFDKDGLIPAVVQDFYSKKVLTVAYMNRESLDISLKEKRTCFYSRSRRTLWRKGETSGNVQRIVRVTADCDGDALVVEVIPAGPACHTNAESCFYNLLYQAAGIPAEFLSGAISSNSRRDEVGIPAEPLYGAISSNSRRDEEGGQPFTARQLYALILDRKAKAKEGSYTTYLFEKGLEKILKKVGEECAEVIIGAMKGSREETIYEISDLMYHVLVLMAETGITPEDILRELAGRHVIDHKVKQEPMEYCDSEFSNSESRVPGA